MRSTFYTVLSAFLLFSCSSLPRMENHGQSFIPSIGWLGKNETSLLTKNFILAGSPKLKKGISLSVREIQFDKAKFKRYSELQSDKGKQPMVDYVDSLSIKPKYLCLEISDRIALQSQLNSEHNANVRNYLGQDADLQLVSQITFVDNPTKIKQISDADGLFLIESNNGLLKIEVLENGRRSFLDTGTMEIFEYKLSGFCWDTDRFGKERIASISNDGTKCPKGTEKDVQELNETKSYLKL